MRSIFRGHITALAAALLLLAAVACAAKGSPKDASGDPELEAMAGQMLMVGFRGLDADGGSAAARAVRDLGVGGVILFDRDVELPGTPRNIESPQQVRELTRELQELADVPLFVAVDQEGGRVSRLKEKYGFPPSESAAALGRRNDPVYTEQSAYATGRSLEAVGINLDFAPVVDVNIPPGSPVIGGLERSFSSDPWAVARHARFFSIGLKYAGVASCAKHFPGHGSSVGDSHLGLPDITNTWRREELIPYRELIAAGLADMVMVAHLIHADMDPALPASLSPKVVQGMLRGELGFGGIIITDDLQMGAITQHYDLDTTVRLAVEAGSDILLFANNMSYDEDVAGKARAAIVRLVREGRVPRERIQASFDRVMRRKAALGLFARQPELAAKWGLGVPNP